MNYAWPLPGKPLGLDSYANSCGYVRPEKTSEQVLTTSNPRGSVSASTVIDHHRVVEGLYEAFMATFCTNWHASVLVWFFFETAQDRISRDVALYLYRALVEQHSICLKGAASSIGLIRRQAVETSTLGNWTPLRSRLAPIPFKAGLLFGRDSTASRLPRQGRGTVEEGLFL